MERHATANAAVGSSPRRFVFVFAGTGATQPQSRQYDLLLRAGT